MHAYVLPSVTHASVSRSVMHASLTKASFTAKVHPPALTLGALLLPNIETQQANVPPNNAQQELEAHVNRKGVRGWPDWGMTGQKGGCLNDGKRCMLGSATVMHTQVIHMFHACKLETKRKHKPRKTSCFPKGNFFIKNLWKIWPTGLMNWSDIPPQTNYSPKLFQTRASNDYKYRSVHRT